MEDRKKVKVKYYSDRRHYTVIEVYEDEVEKVREINRMTWQEDKAEERRRKKLEEEGITLCSLEKTDADGDDIPDGKMNAEEKIIAEETRAEERKAIREAISKLEPKQQKVIKLVFFEGRTQDEVAAMYGVKKSALSRYLSRIYAILKNNLKNF